jgi:hypothetical protein
MVRLHCAIGYFTPQGKLEGRDKDIGAERDRKLEAARAQRRAKRRAARRAALDGQPANTLQLNRIFVNHANRGSANE